MNTFGAAMRRSSDWMAGQITHAWTQDPESTKKLCAACRIPNGSGDYQEFLGKVDAVIIARDDYETHFRDGAGLS